MLRVLLMPVPGQAACSGRVTTLTPSLSRGHLAEPGARACGMQERRLLSVPGISPPKVTDKREGPVEWPARGVDLLGCWQGPCSLALLLPLFQLHLCVPGMSVRPSAFLCLQGQQEDPPSVGFQQ